MVDDIFKLEVDFELPSGHATIGMYYVQTADHNLLAEEQDSRILAEAWRDQCHAALLDTLSDDIRCPSVHARHVYRDNGDNVKVTSKVSVVPAVGQIAGPSQPNNMAWMVSLQQNQFPKKTKGRFFVPGIPESQTDGNILLAAHVNGAIAAFVAALAPALTHGTDGGTYVLSVRSWKVFFAPIQAWKDGGEVGDRPDPDWPGSMTPATSVSVPPAISPMKVRGTKVRGRAAA